MSFKNRNHIFVYLLVASILLVTPQSSLSAEQITDEQVMTLSMPELQELAKDGNGEKSCNDTSTKLHGSADYVLSGYCATAETSSATESSNIRCRKSTRTVRTIGKAIAGVTLIAGGLTLLALATCLDSHLASSSLGSSSPVFVNNYFRKNGTSVSSHWRTSANDTVLDNWSTSGNVNPFTGRVGTK